MAVFCVAGLPATDPGRGAPVAPFAMTGTDTGGWLGEVTRREATTGELSLDPEAATCNEGGQSGLGTHKGHIRPQQYKDMSAYLCKRRLRHIRYLRRRHVYVPLASPSSSWELGGCLYNGEDVEIGTTRISHQKDRYA